MTAHDLARTRGLPVVAIYRSRASLWDWTLANPAGGSAGSTGASSKRRAVACAAAALAPGTPYLILTERWTGARWRAVSVVEAVR